VLRRLALPVVTAFAMLLASMAVAAGPAHAASSSLAVASPARLACTIVAKWDNGYVLSCDVYNSGAPQRWVLEFALPVGTQVIGSWNVSVSQAGQHYTVRPSASTSPVPVPEDPYSFGLVFHGTGLPYRCLFNGEPCRLV